jgi:FixJ family two-component response regulator
MRDGTGPDLAAKLANARPGLKVLFMSGYTENGIVHDGILTRGVHFIAKPFASAALLDKVHEVLEAP